LLLVALATAHRHAQYSVLEPFAVEVAALPIMEFAISPAKTGFGALNIIGSQKLSGSSSKFGDLSALRFGSENLINVTGTIS
jgi:hypothetical protein